jgi:DNA-binding NarL/FixJ family response regulator
MTSAKKVRILLVDDHPIVLTGLRNSLECFPRYKIVGEASDGLSALRQAETLKPDVILMDISLPKMNGLEASKILLKKLPQTKIVVLTMHDNPEYVVEIIKSGAQGYVLKNSPPSELLQAIDKVYSGESYYSPVVGEVLANEVRHAHESMKRREQSTLTRREQDIIKFVAEGTPNVAIAQQLSISVRTVEAHRRNIMQKLELYTVAELTQYAIREGIIVK